MFITGALIFVFANVVMRADKSSENLPEIFDNTVLLVTIISAVTIAVVTVSYLISLKVMQNKEV